MSLFKNLSRTQNWPDWTRKCVPDLEGRDRSGDRLNRRIVECDWTQIGPRRTLYRDHPAFAAPSESGCGKECGISMEWDFIGELPVLATST